MSKAREKTSEASAPRGPDGKLLPGARLNPGGKPRDMATRQECQRELYSRGPELVACAVEYALGGDKKMLEFLLGKLIPDPPAMAAADEGAMQGVRTWTVAELQAATNVQ